MMFKIGDKVLVEAPSWFEECVVHEMGLCKEVMYVRRANGYIPFILKSWASIIKPKNQQLEFDFYME